MFDCGSRREVFKIDHRRRRLRESRNRENKESKQTDGEH
jgi:hypothetical protein